MVFTGPQVSTTSRWSQAQLAAILDTILTWVAACHLGGNKRLKPYACYESDMLYAACSCWAVKSLLAPCATVALGVLALVDCAHANGL